MDVRLSTAIKTNDGGNDDANKTGNKINYFVVTALARSLSLWPDSGFKWTLYIGLTMVGAVCVALGALIARGYRKGCTKPFGDEQNGKIYSPVDLIAKQVADFCQFTLCSAQTPSRVIRAELT